MARVAILIDGDNIGAGYADQIAGLGHKAGRVVVHRAYADATNGSGWNSVAGVRLIHAGSGKNAADLLLTVDAIELALTGLCETIILASSDGDFTHCATRLRERGFVVIGVGEAKAPEGFRRSCTQFEDLAPLHPESKAPVSNQVTKLDRRIFQVITKHGAKNRSIHLSSLGNWLKDDHGISKNDLPKATLKEYLSGKPEIYVLYPNDAPFRVRLAPGAIQP